MRKVSRSIQKRIRFAGKKVRLLYTAAVLAAVLLGAAVLGENGYLSIDLPGWLGEFTQPYQPVAQLTGEEVAAVHFIDVGQGDSVLIQAGEAAVLIDAGERDQGQKVCEYLKAAGVQQLDLVIATHPHSDHIGGLPDVIEQFPVEEILMPDLPDEMVPTTAVFQRLVESVEQQQIPVTAASAGMEYPLAEGVCLTVLAPLEPEDDLNNVSVVCRLDCGANSFLFCGDAEEPVEEALLDSAAQVKAQVLKAGHHGSNTSSSGAFLDAVSPSIAVISCGQGNDYGHPHREVLDRLSQRAVTVYRTDQDGTVVLTSDGQSIAVQTETGGAQ